MQRRTAHTPMLRHHHVLNVSARQGLMELPNDAELSCGELGFLFFLSVWDPLHLHDQIQTNQMWNKYISVG